MIFINNVTTAGWEPAIRGMRNPMNSWDKSDSAWTLIEHDDGDVTGLYQLGPNDLALAIKLRNAGTDHRKFMRMIVCYCDIIAPLYWWKEFDTYRNGVEKNSCSTMHKITEKEFTKYDFSCERTSAIEIEDNAASPYSILQEIIKMLNACRAYYLKTKDKDYWNSLIQLLPTSYNQRRTCMISYEALANMYHARKHHKLTEWRTFCSWIETLPYSELITGGNNE